MTYGGGSYPLPTNKREDDEMIKITEVTKVGKNLIVTVGADDPNELMEERTADLAYKTASRKGFKEINHIGNVHCYGQSRLATRRFTFTR